MLLALKGAHVAMQNMSNVLGSGILKQPNIRIARRKGLLCIPCYNEEMVAITGNTGTLEPLTSDQEEIVML